MKKTTLIIFGALCLISIPLTSFAESGFCSGVKVLETGSYTYEGVVGNSALLQNTRSDCGNWANGGIYWFSFNEANRDAMLITTLTALTRNLPVSIVSENQDNYSNWGIVTQLYVSARN